MTNLIEINPAPNAPGQPLNWCRADKDAIGTARSLSSMVWYTTAGGIITEVYYPNVDTPQVRDFQLIITDGSTFFHDATKDFNYTCEPLLDESAQGIRLTLTAKNQPYTVVQDIISEPSSSCLLMRVTLQGDQTFLNKLHVYALLTPHMHGYGAGNSAFVVNTPLGERLVATRDNYWLALGADCGFGLTSCGFVAVNDGWTDIIANKRLPKWEYKCAKNGYVALTGEINRNGKNHFVLALAFCYDITVKQGETTPYGMPNVALTTVSEALAYPFDDRSGTYSHLQAFIDGWKAIDPKAPPLFLPKAETTGDGNKLFNKSRNVLYSHEDKTANGALIASLSIPWGQTISDLACGYHVVWPRDMCQSAIALLAAGEVDLPLRALMFLANSQSEDGSFHQKFFIDGQPWPYEAVQLDEYSFPIILAYRLSKDRLLQGFDPKKAVLAAVGALIANGPMTQQERWEELEGYSPSTLASNIAALVCAAEMVTQNNWAEPATAQFLYEYADFLESHLEAWCVTTEGKLLTDVQKHYIRILPTNVKGGVHGYSVEDPNKAKVKVWNNWYDAKEIVDGGFLELVRYGIRAANDPIIVNTIKVVDAFIKKDLRGASSYYRYNHDCYGQGDAGQDWYDGCNFGKGRPWPLLTGERGHYELAAGNDAKPYIKYLEAFAGTRGLLAEQLWDLPDVPGTSMVLGGPTGSAMPLAWAHAEYIKLVRSVSDNQVFDRLDIVANRYQPQPGQPAHAPSILEIWNFDRQFPTLPTGKTVRFPLGGPFNLRLSSDNWKTSQDLKAEDTKLNIWYVDVRTTTYEPGTTLSFNIFWTNSEVWQLWLSNFSIQLV